MQSLRSGAYLGPRHEANPHEVYNDYIVSGYRINYSTWTLTLKSLFQLHNESVNVWTHLFGFFAALVTIVVIACANSSTLQQTMAGTHQALSELIQQKKAEFAFI